MAPRKRKLTSQNEPSLNTNADPSDPPEIRRKRVINVQRERNVSRNRLESLEHDESFLTEDRFTQAERSCILDAYNQFGFQALQDMYLLKQFLPGRTERDLKGLMDRLKVGLQQESLSDGDDKTSGLDEWLKLCQSLMGNFARDKRVNLDDALADALMMVADERELNEQVNPQHTELDSQVASCKPNYPELLRSFSQLLMGKFPNNMTPGNARISSKLFNHITSLVESMNLDSVATLMESGSWLDSSTEQRRKRQEMALLGLDELTSNMKKCPTLRDIRSKNIEALCLELPKIKRITELLNPLSINELVLNGLMDL